MAKGIQNMAGDTKCGRPLAIFCIPTHFVAAPLAIFCIPTHFVAAPLAIFCIPTHFVGDTLSGATPGCISETVRCRKLILGRDIG